jgi:hypothetical protein
VGEIGVLRRGYGACASQNTSTWLGLSRSPRGMIVRTPSDRMPPYKPAGLVVLSVAALALSLRAAGSRPGRAYDDVPQLRIAAAFEATGVRRTARLRTPRLK